MLADHTAAVLIFMANAMRWWWNNCLIPFYFHFLYYDMSKDSSGALSIVACIVLSKNLLSCQFILEL